MWNDVLETVAGYDPTLIENMSANDLSNAAADCSAELSASAVDHSYINHRSDVTTPTSKRTIKNDKALTPPNKAREGTFFCEVCDRKLSDKKNYDKHLQSELHFKRSSMTMDTASSKLERPRLEPKVSTSTKNDSSPFVKPGQLNEASSTPSIRHRYVSCRSCGSTVESEKFGKHLISHFHHHRSLSNRSSPYVSTFFQLDFLQVFFGFKKFGDP